jgi:hypothetical protein
MSSQPGLKAVMICGAGHSGSTLLGMILGSHSQSFYMGEGGKVRYLGDAKKPLRKRVCKICGENCPVWTGFNWDPDTALYAQIALHVEKQVIIDSTKSDQWIEARIAEMHQSGGHPHLILLTRDGRAVVNSRIRKYPEREAETQIRDWMAQMQRSEALFARFDGPKLRIRYEDLAESTETVARQLCEFLGLEFEQSMTRFAEADHHVLGGNSGTQYIAARHKFDDPDDAFVSLNDRTRDYYREHSGDIEIDLRWKTELSEEHAALFNHLAGPTNETMKWEA